MHWLISGIVMRGWGWGWGFSRGGGVGAGLSKQKFQKIEKASYFVKASVT